MSTENFAVGELFGERLKAMRMRRGVKASDLADRLGVSRGYISDLESGKKRHPSIELVKRIARELTVSLGELGVGAVAQGPMPYEPTGAEVEDHIKCVLAEGPRGAARRMDIPELFSRIGEHCSEATGKGPPYMIVAHAEIVFHLATELWDRVKSLRVRINGEAEKAEEQGE
ncbi:MAG TPA: helix-turn-helix transcriptional regulator [Verrucomicrobiae bacterium]|nr:helix-turn-helix transcriptional regulator [Verrucomicrobiae bacterium]